MPRFAIIVACSAGFFLMLFLIFRSLTDVGELRTMYPHVIYHPETQSSTIEIKKFKPPGWVNLGEISPIAVSAIVISEDAAFYTHNGFDWSQLWDAMETNFKKGRFARGGSTITQQVIKNVYLSSEKTIVRKIKEAILTVRIERHVKKKRILEIYLNIAEMGPGVYGIGNASQYYFHKPASSLNAREGAYLAMLLPSPKRYSVSFRKKALTPFARDAIKGILQKLAATKRLTPEQLQVSLSTPLNFESSQIPVPEVVPDDEDEDPEEAIVAPSSEPI